MHIFFQNIQYLGSYYFTRSADDPVHVYLYNSLPLIPTPLLIMAVNIGEALGCPLPSESLWVLSTRRRPLFSVIVKPMDRLQHYTLHSCGHLSEVSAPELSSRRKVARVGCAHCAHCAPHAAGCPPIPSLLPASLGCHRALGHSAVLTLLQYLK